MPIKFFLFFASIQLYPGTWSAHAPIELSVAQNNIFSSYNSLLDRTVATWTDNVTGNPASYQEGAWSVPIEVSTSEYSGIILNSYDSIRIHTMIQNTPVFSKGVFSVFDSTRGQTFAIWLNPLFMLEYSIYDGMAWGPVLNVGASFGPGNVFLTFDFIKNQTFATWIDPLSRPVYAIYSDLNLKFHRIDL